MLRVLIWCLWWTVLLPLRLLGRLVRRPRRRRKERSPGLLVPLALYGLGLLAVSGYTRQRLGLDALLAQGLERLRDGCANLLETVVRLPAVIAALVGCMKLMLIGLAAWTVAWIVKRIPNFLPAITLSCNSSNQGLTLSANFQLIIVLSLPVMMAFSICWGGYESLVAIGYSLCVIVYLHASINPARARDFQMWLARFPQGTVSNQAPLAGTIAVDDAPVDGATEA